jgi:hypothetical protein
MARYTLSLSLSLRTNLINNHFNNILFAIAEREFDQVFTGGLGGYSLINMIISLFQTHPHLVQNGNLGVAFYAFFEFFGTQFGELDPSLQSSSPILQLLNSPLISIFFVIRLRHHNDTNL